MEKLFITYAGAIGCGKSPITNYISTKLGLPVFDTDAIVSEVCEDFLKKDWDEIRKRKEERLNLVINGGKSFICDCSVDRIWGNLKESLIKNQYKYFIISIDLDKETLLKFYTIKSYQESMERIDKVYEDHQNFLKNFSNDINMHINETNYQNRLENVYKVVNQRIKENEVMMK